MTVMMMLLLRLHAQDFIDFPHALPAFVAVSLTSSSFVAATFVSAADSAHFITLAGMLVQFPIDMGGTAIDGAPISFN